MTAEFQKSIPGFFSSNLKYTTVVLKMYFIRIYQNISISIQRASDSLNVLVDRYTSKCHYIPLLLTPIFRSLFS